ncbi:unnamed protein product, partial [Mesorhabditis spiculigera]
MTATTQSVTNLLNASHMTGADRLRELQQIHALVLADTELIDADCAELARLKVALEQQVDTKRGTVERLKEELKRAEATNRKMRRDLDHADFNQAGQICSLIGGRLIQTKNQFENIVAGSQLFDVLAGKSTFIGIRRINGTWSYADGTPLTFQKWKSANETNQVGFDCAMMQGNDFSWYSTKCELKWPFICTFPDGRDGNCPNGWKFYQRTISCYWTPNVNWNQPLNISLYDGEQRCQAQGAHLVSIHSDQENRFVLNLVASVRENQNVQNCDRKPFNQVLIGLNGTGTEHWTDGSAFDYDHRNSGAYTYGFVNDPLCYLDEWDNWRQDDLFGSYKMSPFPFRQLTETQRTAIYYHLGFSQKCLLRRVAKIFLQRSAHHFLMATRFDAISVRTRDWPEYRLPDAIHKVLRANIGDNDEAFIYRYTELCPAQPDRGIEDGRRIDRIQVQIAQNRRGRWDLDEEKKKKKTCAGETHEWEIIAGNCPPGAVDYSEGQECLLGINAPAEYAAAAQTCTMLGGRLVQPRNSLENVLAGSQSIEALHGQAAYLGVRRINGVWRYADGTALAYQNWKNEMVWSVRENWDVTCSQTQGARYLIGLTFSRGPPEWTDGTLYDYTAVDRAGQPSYGIYNDPICPSTGSWYGAAAQNYAGYVCKKRAVAVVGPTLKEKLAKIEKLATLARLNKMPFVPPTSL